MERRVRLGFLTPSSNTVLEPLTTAMAAELPGVSLHFSRFRVTEIALSDAALAQFDDDAVLQAAALLADARVDAIAWSGTSASWLGFGRDEALCRRIQAVTGIPATSSVLALNEALARTGVRRLGLVTPYRDDVQARIVANYASIGVDCAAERHLRLQDNYSFADVTAAELERMVRAVARGTPQAIAIVCTNLQAAPLVPKLEAALRLPVYDSVATELWKSLCLAGTDPRPITRWGSLFELPAL
jgi:maleate isomerase